MAKVPGAIPRALESAGTLMVPDFASETIHFKLPTAYNVNGAKYGKALDGAAEAGVAVLFDNMAADATYRDGQGVYQSVWWVDLAMWTHLIHPLCHYLPNSTVTSKNVAMLWNPIYPLTTWQRSGSDSKVSAHSIKDPKEEKFPSLQRRKSATGTGSSSSLTLAPASISASGGSSSSTGSTEAAKPSLIRKIAILGKTVMTLESDGPRQQGAVGVFAGKLAAELGDPIFVDENDPRHIGTHWGSDFAMTHLHLIRPEGRSWRSDIKTVVDLAMLCGVLNSGDAEVVTNTFAA